MGHLPKREALIGLISVIVGWTGQPQAAGIDSSGVDDVYQRYLAMQEPERKLFFSAYHKFGKQLRAWAVLSACGKAGIAKSIDVPPDEVSNYLTEEVLRLPNASGLTNDDLFLVVGAANNNLTFYKLGYSEAIKTVKSSTPIVCDVGVKLADDILKAQGRTE